MKKKLMAGICLSCFLVISAWSFAQTAGQGQTGVSQKDYIAEHFEHGSVMHRMMLMTGMLSEIMGKISGMMRTDMPIPADRMKAMSELMRDVAGQTTEMSLMMEQGNASPEELLRMQEKIIQMQERTAKIEQAK